VNKNLSSSSVLLIKLSALIFSIPAEALRMKGLVAPQSTAEIKIKINCIWYLKKTATKTNKN
jgi:hypothetical protein